MNDEFVKLRI